MPAQDIQTALIVVISIWLFGTVVNLLCISNQSKAKPKPKRELFIDYCLYIQQIEQERFKRQVRKQKDYKMN